MTIETVTIRQTIEHGPFTFEVRHAFVEDGEVVSAEIITPDCESDGWDPQTLSSDDAYPTAAILAAITAATGRRVEVIDGQMDGRSETWRLTDLGPVAPEAGAATANRRFILVLVRLAATEQLTFVHAGEAAKVARALRDTGCFLAVSIRDLRDGTTDHYPQPLTSGATSFALTEMERHEGAPIRHLRDEAAYRALGAASSFAPDCTDAEIATWALDATLAGVADTARDEDRARLVQWVREGRASR